MRKHNRSMLEGPLISGMMLYTIPIMLTGILQLLFNATDMMIVGQFRGSESVAAVGATTALTNLIVNLFMGMSIGTGVTVAHGIGGRQHMAIHKTVHTTLPLALVSGVILTILGVTFSGSFLEMMGTTEDILPLATVYMQIYFGGITFTMVYNFCAAILRSAGDTKSPLIFLFIAGGSNVALNVIFITVFGMGVDGVALATVISQAISATLVVIALMRRNDSCKLELKKIRFYGSQLKKIISIGLPAGIQGSLFSFSNVLIASSVNSIGSMAMAGHSAAGNLDGFVYTIQNAFMQTTVNYVGQNAGAHNFNRIKKIVLSCSVMVTICGLISGFAMWIFGEPLLSIYLPDASDVKAIEYGMDRLFMVGVPYFLCGLMEISTGALRGIGSSTMPMALSLAGVCGLRIIWVMTAFKAFPTLDCLYFSYPVSWTITAVAQFVCFVFIFRKKRRQYQQLHV